MLVLPRKPEKASKHVWIGPKHNLDHFKSLWGWLLIDSWSCVHPLYAGKNCNGNPISTFPHCYAFQMIFTTLAPRLIQSISRNVHNKIRALKRLWLGSPIFLHLFFVSSVRPSYSIAICSLMISVHMSPSHYLGSSVLLLNIYSNAESRIFPSMQGWGWNQGRIR